MSELEDMVESNGYFDLDKLKKINENLIRHRAEAEAAGDNVKAARLLAEIKSYGPDAE